MKNRSVPTLSHLINMKTPNERSTAETGGLIWISLRSLQVEGKDWESIGAETVLLFVFEQSLNISEWKSEHADSLTCIKAPLWRLITESADKIQMKL